MKKYAIVGSHGVGKTWLVNRLFKEASEEITCRKIDLVSEVVRDCPFPINDKSSVDGGHWIVTEQISRELEAKSKGTDILICDRCAIDPVMYLFAGNRFSIHHFRALYDLAKDWIKTYDRIVYIEADWNLNIKDDGFRDTEKKFQMLVDERFKNFFGDYRIDYLKDIIRVNSLELIEERPEALFKEIYQYLFWSEE